MTDVAQQIAMEEQKAATARAALAAYASKQTAAAVEESKTEPQIATPFETRALPLIARGVPVIPIPARTKAAKLPNWEQLATTDAAKIAEWAKDYADGNTAAVAYAQPGGFCFFEVDKPNFHLAIEEQTGQKFPNTFMVSSRPGQGRGHFYFLHSPESIALGNAQSKDENGKEAWSFRADRRYVVGPKSVHPEGPVYTIVKDAPIVEIPVWLVSWIAANKSSDTKKTTTNEKSEKVFEGGRDNFLISKLGKARQQNSLEYDALLALGHQLNQAHCVPPLTDKEVEKTARSAAGYDVVPPVPVMVGGKNLSNPEPEQVEPADIAKIAYPKFPEWVFGGIPAYEKWVKPFCKVNSRYPEYMMLPLMVLILNYLGTKGVRIEFKGFPLSIFLLLVGRKGRVIKSSSAQDAMEFCEKMGILKQNKGANAEGRSLVFTVGSTEGLGLEMARTNCKSAVLFYDEFSKLIAKMSIENSSFANDLSTTYESGKFTNYVKGHRDNFTHEPGSYCLSLIGCTTDKRYPRLASKLFSAVDGMDERFFVLYQPEVLKDVTPPIGVPIPDDVVEETNKLISKALSHQTYSIDYSEPLYEISKLGNRIEIRAEKWALVFAVLLGKDTIDESCIERGIALSKYEHAVKKYLQVGESITREGALQREIRLVIERAGGVMKLRDLQRKVNYDDYGTELWYRVYGGLTRSGILAQGGNGKHGDPITVSVLVPLIQDEED